MWFDVWLLTFHSENLESKINKLIANLKWNNIEYIKCLQMFVLIINNFSTWEFVFESYQLNGVLCEWYEWFGSFERKGTNRMSCNVSPGFQPMNQFIVWMNQWLTESMNEWMNVHTWNTV